MSVAGHQPGTNGNVRNGLPEAWGYSIETSPQRRADRAREDEVARQVAEIRAAAQERADRRALGLPVRTLTATPGPAPRRRRRPPARPARPAPHLPPVDTSRHTQVLDEAAAIVLAHHSRPEPPPAAAPIPDGPPADDSVRCRRKGCGYKILYCQCARGPLL